MMCEIDSSWEAAIQHREFSLVLSDDQDVCEGVGGKSKKEGMHVYIELIHFIAQQS